MTKISKSQVIGNQGEIHVAYCLSEFCLVRTVAAGTDVGVDLYCESIFEDQPNNHFWVQVKSSKRVMNSIRIEVSKLDYWERQPIPVFIFLSSENNRSKGMRLRVINLTEYFLNRSSRQGKKITLKADFEINSKESLKRFVQEIIPIEIARRWLLNGMIMPAKPGIRLGYFMRYPSDGAHKFANPILKNIGRTASMLLKDILDYQEENLSFLEKRIILEAILECFNKYGNYDFHYHLALSRMKRGDFLGAKAPFERTLKCVKGDSRVDQNEKSWAQLKQQINDCLEYIDKSS